MLESLFEDLSNTYVIDTSGLITLESTFKYDSPVFKAIWDEIEDMITHGRFRTIDFVETEINEYEGKQEFLKQWIKQHKKRFVAETDANSLRAALPVINQEYNTGFFDAKKQAVGKEEADPYLIGYCKVHKCILITAESKTKPNRIPQVSAKHGVRCIDIFEFLEEQGLKMSRRNS